MLYYANDHEGRYPTGKSSTEAFQKLIDGGYIADPSIFYAENLHIPGKAKATTKNLMPKNVCWDVTIPADMNHSDLHLPLVFSTGYRIEYVPNGRALPFSEDRVGAIAISDIALDSWFQIDDGMHNGVLPNLIPASFDAKGVKYVQLTPDGPLP
jgi:hypothetical protein